MGILRIRKDIPVANGFLLDVEIINRWGKKNKFRHACSWLTSFVNCNEDFISTQH